jgi:hypothetical protein
MRILRITPVAFSEAGITLRDAEALSVLVEDFPSVQPEQLYQRATIETAIGGPLGINVPADVQLEFRSPQGFPFGTGYGVLEGASLGAVDGYLFRLCRISQEAGSQEVVWEARVNQEQGRVATEATLAISGPQ